MSMLDSFFNKGFKAAKCKTLLKLTIPRIKLLRNRRELQIKNMRRDIAKLLETGQEATARIRVEHIIREENMMAAQEILELFSELISVRLPIIETQRECPLDLKEAISSVCFAAPRCADLPELLQVQMQFAVKYGKEFVAAATELRPDCGVNRQLIELLSVRAPSPETKLKLLKEIAEEHELDWDSAATENDFLKPHEDLLSGPTQFVSGTKLPLPEEKHDETLYYSSSTQAGDKQPDSDLGFDDLDFPEVPKVVLRPSTNAAVTSSVSTPASTVAGAEINHQSSTEARVSDIPERPLLAPELGVQERLADRHGEMPQDQISENAKTKQFLPFISPPPDRSESFAATQSNSLLPPPSAKSGNEVDLQDVVAAAQAAAETAERAAAAARSAATLAQARIAELSQKKNDWVTTESGDDNPFSTDAHVEQAVGEELRFDRQDSVHDLDYTTDHVNIHQIHESHQVSELTDLPSFDKLHIGPDSSISNYQNVENSNLHHQPERLPSMDDEPDFSYPNLFRSTSSNLSPSGSFTDNSRTTH